MPSPERDEIAEMEFFLMFICHQPYSELEKIPFTRIQPWVKVFNEWIEHLFGVDKKRNLQNIAKGINTQEFEALWKEKLELDKK